MFPRFLIDFRTSLKKIITVVGNYLAARYAKIYNKVKFFIIHFAWLKRAEIVLGWYRKLLSEYVPKTRLKCNFWMFFVIRKLQSLTFLIVFYLRRTLNLHSNLLVSVSQKKKCYSTCVEIYILQKRKKCYMHSGLHMHKQTRCFYVTDILFMLSKQ